MTIQLYLDDEPVKINFTVFSDGSKNVNIDWNAPVKNTVRFTISPRSNASDILWDILLVRNAISRFQTNDEVRYSILIPYMPNARADRVFNIGDSCPLKVFLSILDLHFDKIITCDLHNDKPWFVQELIRSGKLHIHKQYEIFLNTLLEMRSFNVTKNTLFISPDQGSREKINELVYNLDHRDIDNSGYLCATKRRDLIDGKITSTELENSKSCEGKDCVIVDDICDGGGTFIPLAKILKESGAKSVTLWVTHGIFAKGLDLFRPYIDKIYVSQHVGTYINHTDLMYYNHGEEVK